ncbi:MAG: M43 family zinc metalloprotease [Vicingaceae bacterium]|nr:M43 family zinc metalloprotease [Vicingaceae bacterium]
MKKVILFALLFSAFNISSFSQNTRTCGTMDNVSAIDIEAFEKSLTPILNDYLKNQNEGNNSKKVVYTIPTIVHIIHNSNENVGSGRNIPYSRVQSQLEILNDDFRRTNSDASNTPSYFQGVAADCEINFCLITKYPSGHPMAGQTLPEVGVDRVSTASIGGISNTSSGYSMNTINNTIKPATSWNPNEVMNIWVCQLQSGLLGYATFPSTSTSSTTAQKDGTVMGYQYFGNNSSAFPFHLGRTTTHEVGHWLGLYHIWGDDNGACSGSDLCGDTPNQANSTGGCPNGVRTDACTSGNGIMYQNYMDYSNDNCMNLFTANQKSRMHAIMGSYPRRQTLNSFSSTLCSSTTDINEFANSNINIYPNPTKGNINVSFENNTDATIEVFNMVGKLITSNTIASKNFISININNQPVGVYFVKVKSGDSTETQKVMLTK